MINTLKDFLFTAAYGTGLPKGGFFTVRYTGPMVDQTGHKSKTYACLKILKPVSFF